MSNQKVTDNLSVIKKWKEGKNARNHAGTLWTDGPVLWSQHRKIGHRTKAGVCVVADLTLDDAPNDLTLANIPGNYETETTLCHIKLAKPLADTVFHQLVSESSPLFTEEFPF